MGLNSWSQGVREGGEEKRRDDILKGFGSFNLEIERCSNTPVVTATLLLQCVKNP